MSVLFYWKRPIFEKQVGEARSRSRFRFFSKYPALHQATKGDAVWLLAKEHGYYVLVGKVVVDTVKKEHSPHGDFCVVGDSAKSIYFETRSQQRQFLPVVRSLGLLGKTKGTNSELGLHFQGVHSVQVLDSAANAKIESYSKTLRPFA